MTRQIANYMNWIDNAAEENVDDMRSYRPGAYREALQAVAERASTHEVDELGMWILERVDAGIPPDSQWVRRRGLAFCEQNGYDATATCLAR